MMRDEVVQEMQAAKAAAERAQADAAGASAAVATILEALDTKFDQERQEREAVKNELLEKYMPKATAMLEEAEAMRTAMHLIQGDVQDMKGKVEAMHSTLEGIKASDLFVEVAIKGDVDTIKDNPQTIKSMAMAFETHVNDIKKHADSNIMEAIAHDVAAIKGGVNEVKSNATTSTTVAQSMESLHGEVANTQAVAEATQKQTVTSMRHLKFDISSVRTDLDTIKTDVSAIRETLRPPAQRSPSSSSALKRNASSGPGSPLGLHLPPVDSGAKASAKAPLSGS